MVYISCNNCVHVLLVIGVVCVIFTACENFDENYGSELTEQPEMNVEDPLELNSTAGSAGFRRGQKGTYSSSHVTQSSRHQSTLKGSSREIGTTTKKGRTTTTRPPLNWHSTSRPPSTTRRPPFSTKSTTGPISSTFPTTRKPLLPLTDEALRLLFGGLSGSTLGLYLGHQIGKIQRQDGLPAYTVQHYWHEDGISPLVTKNTEIENGQISKCSPRAFFCLPRTIPMCLTSGKIYCVVKQEQLLPCSSSKVGACFLTNIRLPCKNSLSSQCIFFDWKYKDISIPCLKYMKVKYTQRSNENDKMFKIPRIDNTTVNANNTCRCNKTISWTKRIGEVTCVLVQINKSKQMLCSGLNLSKYTSVSINSTLNSKNTKNISCTESRTPKNDSILNIYNSQKKSLLSRCKLMSSTSSIDMMCGHVGNLTNTNASIPFNAVVLNLECQTTLNSIFADLKIINMTTNISSTCPCNVTKNVTQSGSVLAPNVIHGVNRTGKIFVSTDFCVYVAAFPFKLHTNREYAKYLDMYKTEKKLAVNKINRIMSAIANFIFF